MRITSRFKSFSLVTRVLLLSSTIFSLQFGFWDSIIRKILRNESSERQNSEGYDLFVMLEPTQNLDCLVLALPLPLAKHGQEFVDVLDLGIVLREDVLLQALESLFDSVLEPIFLKIPANINIP